MFCLFVLTDWKVEITVQLIIDYMIKNLPRKILYMNENSCEKYEGNGRQYI